LDGAADVEEEYTSHEANKTPVPWQVDEPAVHESIADVVLVAIAAVDNVFGATAAVPVTNVT
jgi:hypothetical protein